MTHIYRRFSFSFLAGMLLGSCIQETEITDFSYSISPQIGAPIAHASVFVHDAIQRFDEEADVAVGDAGLLSLIYRDSIVELDLSNILQVNNQETAHSFSLSAAEIAQWHENGSFTLEETRYFILDFPEGDILDSIGFLSGVMGLQMAAQSAVPISGSVAVVSPDGSEVLRFEFTDDNPTIGFSQQSNLAHKVLHFLHTQDIKNALPIRYRLTFGTYQSAQPGEVSFGMYMQSLSIASAGGYIAPRTLNLNNVGVGLTFFKDAPAQIRIEDPKLHFQVANRLGVDAQILVSQLRGVNQANDQIQIPGTSIEPLPLVESATYVGDEVRTALTIDNTTMTPNLTEFMAFMPTRIGGDFQAVINPNNKQATFVNHPYGMQIFLEAELPIWGSIMDFNLIDTTGINLGDFVKSVEDVADIQEVLFKIFTENGLPVDVGAELIFADSLFQPIDSLFGENLQILTSAPVNYAVAPTHPDYGRATGKTPSYCEVLVSRERALALADAKYLIVKVFGHTSGNGDRSIRIFTDDALDVKLAAKAVLNLESGE